MWVIIHTGGRQMAVELEDIALSEVTLEDVAIAEVTLEDVAIAG